MIKIITFCSENVQILVKATHMGDDSKSLQSLNLSFHIFVVSTVLHTSDKPFMLVWVVCELQLLRKTILLMWPNNNTKFQMQILKIYLFLRCTMLNHFLSHHFFFHSIYPFLTFSCSLFSSVVQLQCKSRMTGTCLFTSICGQPNRVPRTQQALNKMGWVNEGVSID